MIIDRKLMATDATLRLRKETNEKTKAKEADWQNRTAKWMAVAARKVRCAALLGHLMRWVAVCAGDGSSCGCAGWLMVLRCVGSLCAGGDQGEGGRGRGCCQEEAPPQRLSLEPTI